MAVVAVLTAGAAVAGAPGETARAGAAPTSPELVPFTGTYFISATWGNPSGGYHIQPAIDIQMETGTPVLAAGSGTVRGSGHRDRRRTGFSRICDGVPVRCASP